MEEEGSFSAELRTRTISGRTKERERIQRLVDTERKEMMKLMRHVADQGRTECNFAGVEQEENRVWLRSLPGVTVTYLLGGGGVTISWAQAVDQ